MRMSMILLLSLAVLPVSALSNTIHVPGDQPTIQAGIDAAVPGDEVLVGAGTYTGAANKNLELHGKDMVVRSESGAAVTVIDCQGSGRAFNLYPPLTSAARIEGFTIQNGDGDAGSNQGGGGMYVVACSPTIDRCIFQDNVAVGTVDLGGGGAAALEFSSSVVSSCTFLRNHVLGGGGAGGVGGALIAKRSSVTITDCDFQHNQAGDVGGAVGILDFSSPESSQRGSGGIFSCRFVANEANYGGGGVGCAGNDMLAVTDCVFYSNEATFGGGVYMLAPLSLARCTFVGNEGLGSIFCQYPATIDNTIIQGTQQGPALIATCSSQLIIRCTDIHGNPGGDWLDCLESYHGVEGNIALDPLFCDLPVGDLHLCPDSPCAPDQTGSCGLIGALPVGCGACGVTAVEPATWGQIKHGVGRR
jgi:hypothetical protein